MTRELQEQLEKFFKSMDEDERKPWLRYWGGPVESYYELIWAKEQVACENTSNFYWSHLNEKEELKPEFKEEYERIAAYEHLYFNMLKILRIRFPHLIGWSDEMLGICCTRIC